MSKVQVLSYSLILTDIQMTILGTFSCFCQTPLHSPHLFAQDGLGEWLVGFLSFLPANAQAGMGDKGQSL